MKQVIKKSILAVALSGAVIGASALAQDTQTPTAPNPTQQAPTPQDAPLPMPGQDQNGQMNQGPRDNRGPGGGHHDGPGEHRGPGMDGPGGQGRGFGVGLPFGRGLELGTSLTVTFYDGDPANSGTVLSTLNFTYGEDSEVAFQTQFEEARVNAAYIKVDTSEQTRTVDLSKFDANQRQELKPRELFRLHDSRPGALNDGSTLTATFYDGDPEAGGTVTETLTFTYGTSSEAGFANDFATASETAAFVTITTSPQTQTVDLAAMPVGSGGRDGVGPDQPR
jgi:hypothetical protein